MGNDDDMAQGGFVMLGTGRDKLDNISDMKVRRTQIHRGLHFR